MTRLSNRVKDHLEQAKDACLAAVETYNKPGSYFRTRSFTVLMVIAWTSLFHGIFYRRKQKPWYVQSGQGKGTRYKKVNGEPKHWDFNECVRRFYGSEHPPERANLEFISRLRDRIEHRHHPELDPALYGECQALLMNFEKTLAGEFGRDHALAEHLDLALQFSTFRPEGQEEAIRRLNSQAAKDLLGFIENYRVGLPPETLDSPSFAVRVFLIPKLANRESSADLSVEFVPYDKTLPEDRESLRRISALIKNKKIPVVSEGLMKPSEIVRRVGERITEFSMGTHTRAWKFYQVRPPSDSDDPEVTRSEFCVYDSLLKGYGYTDRWVGFLIRKLSDPVEFGRVTRWQAPK